MSSLNNKESFIYQLPLNKVELIIDEFNVLLLALIFLANEVKEEKTI